MPRARQTIVLLTVSSSGFGKSLGERVNRSCEKRLRKKAKEEKEENTHPFNRPFAWTTRVGRYQQGKNESGFY